MVSDLNDNALKDAQKLGTSVTKNYKDIINSDIEAISICTPASTHASIAIECMNAGKHVLVEKPLALNRTDAENMVETAEKNNVILMVGHTFRFDPAVKKAKELKVSGEFGNIHYLSLMRMGLRKPREDCGVIFNFAVHDFDIITNILDERPTEITAITTNTLKREFEDFALIVAKFKSGVLGYSQVGWLSPVKLRDFWIVGEKKSAFVDSMKNELVVYDSGSYPISNSFGDYKIITREGGKSALSLENIEPLKEELKHFIECIQTRKRPISDGKVGLEIVKILEAAMKSAQNGVPVNLENAL